MKILRIFMRRIVQQKQAFLSFSAEINDILVLIESALFNFYLKIVFGNHYDLLKKERT